MLSRAFISIIFIKGASSNRIDARAAMLRRGRVRDVRPLVAQIVRHALPIDPRELAGALPGCFDRIGRFHDAGISKKVLAECGSMCELISPTSR